MGGGGDRDGDRPKAAHRSWAVMHPRLGVGGSGGTKLQLISDDRGGERRKSQGGGGESRLTSALWSSVGNARRKIKG